MPIWSEILTEIGPNTPLNYDQVRRKYLVDLFLKTNRPVILYATAWVQKPSLQSNDLSINDEDIQALMEVSKGIGGNDLDLILHSPGGSPVATEAIVSYLRSRFTNIRVIVPQLAMSAATLLACSANKIVLGKHSFLGPTDPQISISTNLGVRFVPAQAVLDQFDLAKRECTADPVNINAWGPILRQYTPDLLIQCKSALEMTKILARTWLEKYMFVGDKDSSRKATEISSWLSDHQKFKSHSRHISREEIKAKGMIVENLEEDQEFQDIVLSVYHSTTHTFTGTPAVKIVENHLGRAFMKVDLSKKN